MPTTVNRKRRIVIVGILVTAALALTYYLRPFWWETYRYENDQLKISYFSPKSGATDPPLEGTVVISIKGKGLESCSWSGPAVKHKGAEASSTLHTIRSVAADFTDEKGLVKISAHQGVGHGKRGIIVDCLTNQGFLVLIKRPGYQTRVFVPRVDEINPSHASISPPGPRRDTTSIIQHGRNRLGTELRLLYPTRLFTFATRPDEVQERQALMNLPKYWDHKLPDGQSIRDYAINNLLQLNDSLKCPNLENKIRKIFSDRANQPVSEAEVLAEHGALLHALSTPEHGVTDDCS